MDDVVSSAEGAEFPMSAHQVLVVDDEQLILLLIEATLQDAGFEPLTASSAFDAIICLGLETSAPIALITDIQLGAGSDGWAVARAARERYADIPVIYITGDSHADWPSQGVRGSVLIGKPFAAEQIAAALADLLTDSEAGEAARPIRA